MTSGPRADWRKAADYGWLLNHDRSAWAWEWLRRDPDYRRQARRALDARAEPDACRADPGARAWGLHRFEDPRLDAREASPMWTAPVWPATLTIKALPAADAGFHLSSAARGASLTLGMNGTEHWLVADRSQLLRLDVVAGTLSLGPARLWLELRSPSAIEASITALRQLADLWRRTGVRARAAMSRAQATRLVRLLRVADALSAHETQREIAAVLFDQAVKNPRWRIERPTIRLQVQRLVRNARAFSKGGYRKILGVAE